MTFDVIEDMYNAYVAEHPNSLPPTHLYMSFRDYEELCSARLMVDGREQKPVFFSGFQSSYGWFLSFIVERRDYGDVRLDSQVIDQ